MMKCESCGKEGKPHYNPTENCYTSGASGRSNWPKDQYQLNKSIFDCRFDYENGHYHTIKCDLVNRVVVYCSDCANRICSKKCIDCKILVRDAKLKKILE